MSFSWKSKDSGKMVILRCLCWENVSEEGLRWCWSICRKYSLYRLDKSLGAHDFHCMLVIFSLLLLISIRFIMCRSIGLLIAILEWRITFYKFKHITTFCPHLVGPPSHCQSLPFKGSQPVKEWVCRVGVGGWICHFKTTVHFIADII